ncbi:nitroreductase family deazaflavin-dependent oxidoreductase [Pseudonocardia kunmingensis]|uniref:Deazaflavin-dependent oxidoreductase (Nitroreductase family) n=1 Tax=Pseudonocardia kunmingensis TaxID=630975 RepID=A0A543DW55_9PSEU|nr:nitroreductase family deazaflavin-dependent oxidoreductase [Pseudonocardia kunmingensis]TQM13577.1 deazaflavin-dependent oxidoreductase (nitroreductase family) [Pseudonocardia kunmingensis]
MNDSSRPVVDSPEPSVAEHVQRYLATDGASGYREGGMPNLLLTTVGRRTGTPRRTALFFDEDDGRYVLVASHFAGGPRHPSWYLNLVANPDVQVQVRRERFAARARTATGAERERLWRQMVAKFPPYRTYQAHSTRVIPVVVLERVGQRGAG